MSDFRARLKKLEEKARKPLLRSFVRDGFRFIGGALKNAGFLKVPVMDQEQWEAAAKAEAERITLRDALDVEADAKNS